jgi:hypothetical protein
VWAAATGVVALLVGWLLPPLLAAVGAPPPVGRVEEWLVVGCGLAAVGATSWWWLLVSLVTLEAAGTTSGHRSPVPAALRRVVLAACGAGLVGGLGAPAYASTPPSPLTGLPLPDRPTTHALPRHPVGPADPAAAADRASVTVEPGRTVRVAVGDSLWALAAADLPEHASAADVDERWRAIHAANRRVIGGDPDLIHPGQRLRLPPGPPSTT